MMVAGLCLKKTLMLVRWSLAVLFHWARNLQKIQRLATFAVLKKPTRRMW